MTEDSTVLIHKTVQDLESGRSRKSSIYSKMLRRNTITDRLMKSLIVIISITITTSEIFPKLLMFVFLEFLECLEPNDT